MQKVQEHQCPVCSSKDLLPFFDMRDIPVYCNVLWPSREAAINAPRGDIDLVLCRGCGHIFNSLFDPRMMNYTARYENSLHFSPKFQDYARSLALSLIDKHELRKKILIEVGCGKGDFLRMMCEYGQNEGYGFDPSYEPERSVEGNQARVRFIKDYYSDKYSSYAADFIYSRHVLEHVHSPMGFLEMIKGAAGSGGTVFTEVPNALFTLSGEGIWDILYEHYSYFTPASLYHLFSSAGLPITGLYESFGGQYLCIEAVGRRGTPVNGLVSSIPELEKDVKAFAGAFEEKLASWHKALEDLRGRNKRIVVWGGGTKGVMFLNLMGVGEFIQHVVDINPHKAGKFLPGTGQEIVPPVFLKEQHTDVVIVMNPLYLKEVRETCLDLAVEPDFLAG